MKLQTKIIILISVLALIFTIVVSLIQYVEKNNTEEILAVRKIEKLRSFEHTIISIGKTLDVFSTDYTQWDEMVDFVQNRDALWALENIEYPIKSIKANGVWIFDDKFNQVYNFNILNDALPDLFYLNKDELRMLFSKNLFNHFFAQANNQLFEIRTAPIQPTADIKRITKPKGYFIVCKLWTKDVIDEIKMLTSSNIKVESAGYNYEYQHDDDFKIKVSKTLNDWKGTPLVKLTSIGDFSLLKKSSEVFNMQMILGVSLSVSVLFCVSAFLIISVNKPLRIIYQGLVQQNPQLLVKTAKENNEFGKLAGLIIQFFDQKERLVDEANQRKFVEASLSKSEEKYKKIFDNVQDVFFQTDLNGKIVSVSPSIERYSEYKPEEVLGKNILDYYLDPAVRLKFLNDLKTKGEVIDFEIYFVKKSGKAIPCSVNAHFIYENKNPFGIEGSLRDASERKKNEEQILKLSRAIEQSPVSIAITDIYGRIDYINPQYTLTSGYTLEDISGREAYFLKRDEHNKDKFKEILDSLATKREWMGELLNKRKNGELYWEQVLVSPIKNTQHEIINYLIIKEDITEKKKIIEELKTAKEKAEEMNNLKSSFLANMSHELRTPMMGILGNAEIINISSEDEEIKDMASAIYQSGKRLINTLNLILDLSRIEAHKDIIDIEKVEITSVIEDVVQHFYPAAKQKGLSLTFHCNEKNIFAYVDERLFREILNNLVNNAIKFTNIGGINVSLYTENEKAIIKVIDSGIGIPAKSLGVIFEEFRQVSEGYGRNFEGTGLGLTITKKFVEKLGGKISVKSVLDEGSEFTIEFPLVKEN